MSPLPKQTAQLYGQLEMQTAAIEGMMEQCNMSGASSSGSREVFKFNVDGSDPPMVPDDDPRVRGLVQVLRELRDPNSHSFETDNEKLCRDNSIIPFFDAVAEVYGVSTTEPIRLSTS